MKQLLLTGAAIFTVLAAAPANAAVTASLANSGSNFLTLSNTGLSDGTTTVATLLGGTVYKGDQPFADQPAGTIFGGTFLAAGPTSGTTATLLFTTATNFLGFLWGSPDTYNQLTVNSATGSQTFTAAGLGFPVTNGSQSVSQYVQFRSTAGSLINSVSFTNVPSVDAFESANFSITTPVPEPATWALMLVGFGGIGFAMRRRKSKVTTNVSFA